MALNLVTMGTGSLALPTLLALYDSPHRVVGLVTQPERTGRGHHHHENPVKTAAVEQGTPVFQPEKINLPESVQRLREFGADLFIVAAYGQILSPEVLSIPRLGAINLHASLLPKYRGATPIHHAILGGDAETGVTIIQLEPKLDAGPILGVVRTPIGPEETTGELEQRLSELAVPLTMRVLDQLEAGVARREPQDSTLASKAGRFTKQHGQIRWDQPADQIERHLRAMQPWPMPFTFLEQPGHALLRLLVLKARPIETAAGAPPGAVIHADQQRLVVQTGSGALELLTVQPEGKRPMPIADFLRGHHVQAGARFTNPQPDRAT